MPDRQDTLEYHARLFRVAMPIEKYHRLPQNPDYKVEYANHEAIFEYRPRMRMARLVLPAGRFAVETSGFHTEPLDFASRREELVECFASAFCNVAPLDSLPATDHLSAARGALRYTEEEGDGTLIPAASFAAIDSESSQLIGAAIVSRISLRKHDRWPGGLCPNQLPNLTWIFVSHLHQRQGVAGSLLARVTDALHDAKESWLISNFQTGNAASVLFHWRCGFELLPDPFNFHARQREACLYDGRACTGESSTTVE